MFGCRINFLNSLHRYDSMKNFGLAFASLFLTGWSIGQTLTYEIIAIGINTGTMTVSKTENSGSTTYSMVSDAGVNYLFDKIEVKNTTKSIFKDGKLSTSYSRTDKNGEMEQYASVKKTETGYSVSSERGSSTISQDITFDLTSVYFKEPTGKTQVFYNLWGAMVSISSDGNGKYTVTDPNGKKQYYYYENGKLTKVEYPSSVGTVTLKLKE